MPKSLISYIIERLNYLRSEHRDVQQLPRIDELELLVRDIRRGRVDRVYTHTGAGAFVPEVCNETGPMQGCCDEARR